MPTRLWTPIIAVMAALVLGACGSDDDAGDGDGAGQTGGSITAGYPVQPDSLDPALSYTADGWSAVWVTYLTPVTYRHAEGERGSELVPGLAEDLPEVSADGRTYTFRFREGLEYSDGTPLRASDFEHTLKRVLSLESGGTSFYEGIVGVPEYLDAGRPNADIEGVEADDDTGEVTIRLAERDSSFTHKLALPFVGLVPAGTPFEDLTTEPPPGIGQFKITSSEPNREFVLEKNETFPEIEDVPAAKLDRITVRIIENQRRTTQNVIDGELDYMFDPPAVDLLPQVRERYGDRYEENVTNSTYYFWLNTQLEPFEEQQVREAVHTGLDKPAIARLYGGLLEPTCNFLPPDMPGHEQLDPCPFGSPDEPGDKERAREMIEEAGALDAEVVVWGPEEEPTTQVVQNFVDQLNEMGLDASPRLLAGPVFGQSVTSENTEDLHAGFYSWFQDYPHPASFMVVANGNNIQPVNNQNTARMDVPEINEEIERLTATGSLEDNADDWAALDRQVVEYAGIIPYGNRVLTTFVSEQVDFDDCTLWHPVYQDVLSSFCLK